MPRKKAKRKTKKVVIVLPHLGVSAAKLKTLQTMFRNQLVQSLAPSLEMDIMTETVVSDSDS